MYDINKQWIEVPCPRCNYIDLVQLIDIKCEKTIFCHNCKAEITLIDSGASVHKAIETVNDSIKQISNLLKNFGK